MLARTLFLLLLVFSATPWCSPPLALVLGAALGLSLGNPFAGFTRKASKLMLQAAVVGLGFGMDLFTVLRAGRSGFLYTLCGIAFALALGKLLARAFSVSRNAGYLISVGTAICGGSAIAALGPVIDASDEEMSVSVAAVFLLNAVALIIFPPMGHALSLGQTQFGLWAALAIHDTSSVVGAAAKFGPGALQVATTVKLARALWIVPVTLATAAWRRRETGDAASSLSAPHAAADAAAEMDPSEGVAEELGSHGAQPTTPNARGMRKARIAWPWFIGLFVLAAVVNTYVPAGRIAYHWLANAAKVVLMVTLFLIGTGMTRASLKRVGARPLLQGVALWLVVGSVSLLLIARGLIGI